MDVITAYKVKIIGGVYVMDDNDKIVLVNFTNHADKLKLKDLKLFNSAIDAQGIDFCGDLYEDTDGTVYLCQTGYKNNVTPLKKK